MSKNTSHLAGEFLVAGELSRRGYPVSITMGNMKKVDIFCETSKGTIRIDAKAVIQGAFLITKEQVEPDIYYIFVHLKTDKHIERNEPPDYFITRGKDIKGLIKTWVTMQGVLPSQLQPFKDNWGLLSPKP